MANGLRENTPKVSNDTTHLECNPPKDNPFLRNEKDKEGAEYGSKGKNLVQLLANAIKRAPKMMSGDSGNKSEDSQHLRLSTYKTGFIALQNCLSIAMHEILSIKARWSSQRAVSVQLTVSNTLL
jgi:hypothetical protein